MLEPGISTSRAVLDPPPTLVAGEQLDAAAGAPLLAETARLEFEATLQLLAERGSFLTGADGIAIALQVGGSFSYCAVIGLTQIIGGPVAQSDPIHKCLEDGQSIRLPESNGRFNLFVPVLSCGRAIGFFEVVSRYEFSDRDLESISRLAGFAIVALELRQAAERAHAGSWESGPDKDPSDRVLWHAPEQAEQDKSAGADASVNKTNSAEIQTCASCGFPISAGRRLCVECEQKSHVLAPPPSEMFCLQNQQSWLAEHGYTIAAIIVSAITAAVIFWLHR